MIRMKTCHVCCQFCRRDIFQIVKYQRLSYVSFSSKREERKKNPSSGLTHHHHHQQQQATVRSKQQIDKASSDKSDVSTSKKKSIEELVEPVKLKFKLNSDEVDVGKELTGRLNKDNLLKTLNLFPKRPNMRKLSDEYGVKEKLFDNAFMSFRKFCLEQSPLPTELHVLFSDIGRGQGNVEDLFPHFIAHARKVYPHLQFMDELRKISDLRLPHNWYQEARNIERKIIFHAGPTNSGKTFKALERFFSAKSGIYLGPLKLLASEVFHKTNNAGIPCDLITGEERIYKSGSDKEPSRHVSSTIEMLDTSKPYEVAIIDEIQMVRDVQRGWAWTRALLGVCAEEVHMCGEYAAIELVKQLLMTIGEEVEVRNYKRMTPLTILDRPLGSFNNIQPGDCIVAFNKNDIYQISRQVERRGHEVAVIYGSLPPGTKLAQAKKFNDPNDSCKVMVATDAIGMGLNLSIKRIIFWSVTKTQLAETGEKNAEILTTSQALQIAGRAGRFGTQFSDGQVTTFKEDDLTLLKQILSQKVHDVEKAGIYPTYDMIELFAYYLPQATLSNLIDIFMSMCVVDETSYFMCNMDDFKYLADMIEHISSMSLKARYTFCLAPINRTVPFICSHFMRFARKYASAEPLSFDWLSSNVGWPFSKPETIQDLMHLENVFDVMEMYLWLGYRFPDMFPDMELVRDMQKEIDALIKEGVLTITVLLRNNETAVSSRVASLDPDYQDFSRRQKTEEYWKRGGSSGAQMKDATTTTIADNIAPKNTLTRRLIEQGLLSREMVEQLEREFKAKEKEKEKQNKQPTTNDE